MKYLSIILVVSLSCLTFNLEAQKMPEALEIIEKVDANMVSKTSIVESKWSSKVVEKVEQLSRKDMPKVIKKVSQNTLLQPEKEELRC